MSWAWPSRRSRTEKLSNQVMIPCSFTPFTRNMVTGVLLRRRLLRNMSCRLLTLSGIALSFRVILAAVRTAHYHAGWACAKKPIRLFAPLPARIRQAQRLQLPVQRGALHADEIRGPGDVPREAADLDAEIFALERLARLPQRRAHDRLHRLVRRELRLVVEDFRGQHVDLDAADPLAGRHDDGALDDVPKLPDIAGPVIGLQRRHGVIGDARRRHALLGGVAGG